MSAFTDNPFPGLRSFDYEEHHLFFGRERHIHDLLRKLEQHHFVAVVGSSGSGKSSLIRAGLLPAIHQGRLGTEGSNWLIASMKPGNTPLQNLASALTTKSVFGDASGKQERIFSLISESSLGLVQAVRPELTEGKRLLILIDQFEELFRFADENSSKSQAESNAFAQLIIDSVRQRDIPIYIVLTLRSDFLGDCVRFEGLPEAINDGHYLVPRLNKDQNKLAITGPVEYAKGKISPRLVQRVINELDDDQDQLPVLQHALMRTWDCWKLSADPGEPMDLRHYEMIGGMDNALSEHADEAYKELNSEAQQKGIEQIFKCLTVKTGDNRGVRRPTSAATLLAITGMTLSELEQVLLPFRKSGRTFILPPAEKPISEHTIFDISHESLMRGWNRLSKWVDEEMESAEMYQRLCMSAQLAGEGRAALWRDPELQLALDWKTRNKPNEAWSLQYNHLYKTAMDFLEASRIERDREAERKKKRTAAVRAAVITFLVVVSGLTAWALMQTKTATENFKVAEQKTSEALNQKALAEKAKEMALEASRQAMDAKSFAELQSNIAGEQKKLAEKQKAKAEEEAIRAMTQEQEALRQKQLAEQKSREALDQKQKAETSQSEANRLRMIALSQNIAFKSIQQKDDAQLAALMAYQSYKFSSENNGNLYDPQLYTALYTAVQKTDPDFRPEWVRSDADFSELMYSGNKLISIYSNGTARTFEPGSNGTSKEIKLGRLNATPNTAYLSENGNFAVIGMEDFSAALYDFKNPSAPVVLNGHKGLIRAAAFSRDGSTVATGGRDSTVIVWAQDKAVKNIRSTSRIRAMAIDDAEQALYFGGEDGIVYKYNLQSGQKSAFGNPSSGRVQTIRSGNYIVVGYSNGEVQLLDKKGNLVKTINESSGVESISYDDSRDQLIVATANRLIHIYRLSELSLKPIEIKCSSPILSVTAAGKDHIFVACADRYLRKYPARTDLLNDMVEAKLTRKWNEEDWKIYIGQDIPYKP